MRAQILLNSAARRLEAAGVARPRWTAEQLLSRRLGCAPIDLYLPARPRIQGAGGEPQPPDLERTVQFEADAASRAGGVPLQYLLESAPFYGREFWVGPGVFIPRPETEVLVEVCLTELARWPVPPLARSPVVVDVGTGCGPIAITLALGRPDLRVTAVDRSAPALAFARENGARLGARIRWIQGDLLTGMQEGSVDAVTANLPYLDPAESSTWPRELHWEPWLALDGGAGGLSLIRELLPQAFKVLRPGGLLFLEIGAGQGKPASRLASENNFRVERIVPDLSELERVVVLRKAENLKGSDPFSVKGA